MALVIDNLDDAKIGADVQAPLLAFSGEAAVFNGAVLLIARDNPRRGGWCRASVA